MSEKEDDTANSQRRYTVKQAAELMNVSERSVYMVRAVMRLRPDLEPELEAGRMRINEAYRIATGKTKPTSWDRLVRAWNNASDDDRDRFVVILLGQQDEHEDEDEDEP